MFAVSAIMLLYARDSITIFDDSQNSEHYWKRIMINNNNNNNNKNNNNMQHLTCHVPVVSMQIAGLNNMAEKFFSAILFRWMERSQPTKTKIARFSTENRKVISHIILHN